MRSAMRLVVSARPAGFVRVFGAPVWHDAEQSTFDCQSIGEAYVPSKRFTFVTVPQADPDGNCGEFILDVENATLSDSFRWRIDQCRRI
jgi:hypothetical protein